MPFTMAAFTLGSLSIIGLPPFGGAWSKWYLALGAAESHQLVFVGVLMLSSLLSIGYLMPIPGANFSSYRHMPLLLAAGHKISQLAEDQQNRIARRGAGNRHERALGEAALRKSKTQIDGALAVEVGGCHHAAEDSH